MDWSSRRARNETRMKRKSIDRARISMLPRWINWRLNRRLTPSGHVSMKIVACAVPNPTTISLELETGGQSSPEIGPCRGCIFKLFLRDDLRQLRGTLYLFWWFDLRLCAGPQVARRISLFPCARNGNYKMVLEEQDATNIFSSFVRKLEITNHEY